MAPRRSRKEQNAFEDVGRGEAVEEDDTSQQITILVATDHHLGYAERDPVRGRDSFVAFEECLQLAVEHNVDFILFGGDLFHENKPSRSCLFETNLLIRKYCLGDRPIPIQVVSEPSEWARPGIPEINYEDSNLNVAFPIFAIHGNHDDPQGSGPHGALSALDYLSSHGYINYFGRIELNADEQSEAPGFSVKPILIQKGDTKLALYGMGNVRDDRLYYELKSNHIRLLRPSEDPDDWFNILVLHQNRAVHNPKNAVPEGMLDDCFNLIIWGHEHDCRIDPEPIAGKNYFISQPGSTVATSLTEGESKPKHVTIVKIRGREFAMSPIRLKSVRPFVIDEINLATAKSKGTPLGSKHEIQKYLRGQVNKLIAFAKSQWEELHPDSEIPQPLPLIRLKVDYTGPFEIGNSQRFGQEFAGKIANPKDVVQFYRKKPATGTTSQSARSRILEEIEASDAPNKAEMLKLGDLVRETLSRHQLDMLGADDFERAILSYVDKDDRDAIKDFIEQALTTTRREMGKGRINGANVDESIPVPRPAAKSRPNQQRNGDDEVLHSDEEGGSVVRGRTPARAQRADSMEFDSPQGSIDDDFDRPEPPPPPRARAAPGRAKRDPPSRPAPQKRARAPNGSSQQSQLNFPPARSKASERLVDDSDEILDDDDDDDDGVGQGRRPLKRRR